MTLSSIIIDTEMDPPVSLSVSAIALSPISGYQLIDMSILTGVFTLLSCPGCHRIQFLNFKKLMKNGLARHLQLSCTVCLYSNSFFTLKQINLPKKKKKNKNFMV